MSKHSTESVPLTTWKKRLTGVAIGMLALLIGWWLVSHGVFYGISFHYHLPVFTYSAIATGILIILASLAPAGVIAKMAAIRKYQPRQPRQRQVRRH